MKLSELFGRYCDAQKTWDSATRKTAEGDLGQIAQISGDPLLSLVTKTFLSDLQVTLQALPPNINKDPKLKGKPIAEILALGLEPQSSSSVKKKWGYLSAALDHAVRRDWIKSNDARGLTVKAKSKSYEKYLLKDITTRPNSGLYLPAKEAA